MTYKYNAHTIRLKQLGFEVSMTLFLSEVKIKTITFQTLMGLYSEFSLMYRNVIIKLGA